MSIASPPPRQQTTPSQLVQRLRDAIAGADDTRDLTRRVQSHLTEVLSDGGLQLDPEYFEPSGDSYARRLLHRDEDLGFTVVVMTWGPGQSTPVHDHAGIWCVEGVVDGMMEVTQLELVEEGGDGRCRFVEQGHSVSGVGSSGALIPPFEYHSLGNAWQDRTSVTVHVYGGEMDHCSVFEPQADGSFLRRQKSLSYTGEPPGDGGSPAVVTGTVAVDKHPDLSVASHEPFNGGPTPADQRASFLTPNDRFFVRNHAAVPQVDRGAYRLRVGGLVETPRELSLDELEDRLSRAEVVSTLVCAGQRRQEMIAVQDVPGELPWGAEAASTARWSGYRLADLLALVGPRPAARHVRFTGLDEVERHGERFGFGGSIPLTKARSPEVLLADRMNGEPLPPTHGAPLRVVVPGWIGARSVKWLSHVELAESSSENYFQAHAYRLYPPSLSRDEIDPAAGFELGELPVNCLITSPGDGDGVTAGRVRVEGFAHAGGGRAVCRVDLSADGGKSWVTARFEDGGEADPAGDRMGGAPLGVGDGTAWAWRFFSGEVELPPGDGEIVARAWDSAGQTQPSDPAQVWNSKGYMMNAWSRVSVKAR